MSNVDRLYAAILDYVEMHRLQPKTPTDRLCSCPNGQALKAALDAVGESGEPKEPREL